MPWLELTCGETPAYSSTRMARVRRASTVTIVALLLAANVASAETTVYRQETVIEETVFEPDGLTIAADLLIARPMGLITTIAGCAILLVGLPFAALAGDVETPARVLVGEPARFTFDRPLGALDL
jgi:hypothetical protein